ncbi:MAG: hypothetical protein IRZ05_09215 [Micromonosporaceae bacterium]|nr:hypothetical protein [Micromonosporaceae bacterium]
MTALVQYILRDFIRSHRFLPPLIVFGVAFATLYAVHPTPVLSSYGATALSMYPLAAWYTAVLLRAEDPIQRQITIVNSGSSARTHLAKVLTAGLLASPLILAALLLPAALGFLKLPEHQTLLPYLGVGLLAHATAALTGVALGLLWSPPMVQRTGYTFGGILLCLVLTVPLNRLAPPLTATRAMNDGTPPGAVVTDLLPSLLGAVAFTAVAVLAYLQVSRARS